MATNSPRFSRRNFSSAIFCSVFTHRELRSSRRYFSRRYWSRRFLIFFLSISSVTIIPLGLSLSSNLANVCCFKSPTSGHLMSHKHSFVSISRGKYQFVTDPLQIIGQLKYRISITNEKPKLISKVKYHKATGFCDSDNPIHTGEQGR